MRNATYKKFTVGEADASLWVGEASDQDPRDRHEITADMKTALVAKAESGGLGEHIGAGVKGAIVGASVGGGILVGVGAVVVGSVVLGAAGVGAAVGAAFGPFAPFAIPICAAIGALGAFFASLCKSKGHISQAEAKKGFLDYLSAVQDAQKMLKKLEDPKMKAAKQAYIISGYYRSLQHLASQPPHIDPIAFLKDASIRASFMIALMRQNIIMSDAEMVKEVKARFDITDKMLEPKINAKFLSNRKNLRGLYICVAKRKKLMVGNTIKKENVDVVGKFNKRKVAVAIGSSIGLTTVGVVAIHALKLFRLRH